MKTAEEILETTHSFLDDSLGRCYEEVEVLAAMEEYANQFKAEVWDEGHYSGDFDENPYRKERK